MRLTFLVLLTCAGPALGQHLTLPAEARQDSPDPVSVKPATQAPKVVWHLPDGLWSRELDQGRELLVRARAPGRYTLLAFAVDAKGELHKAACVLVMEAAPPEDSFRKDLDALLAQDPGTPQERKTLAALYRQAALFAAQEDIATGGQLLDAVRRAAGTLLPATALRPARQRVADELVRAMPSDSEAALTPELRARAADIFARAALAVEAK